MNTRDFVALTLQAAGGEVQGKTKLQKLLYFVGVLTDRLGELGYRAHFYGPYSDDVAYAIGQLKTIGAVDQNVTDWGVGRSGFEVKRYDYRLNEAGQKFAEGLARRHPEMAEQIRRAVNLYKQAGDRDYMELSIAAKTYFLLGQKKGRSRLDHLVKLASRFGWNVSERQIKEAAEYLQKLGLVELVSVESI
jgi:uncharacterized protein YwgA